MDKLFLTDKENKYLKACLIDWKTKEELTIEMGYILFKQGYKKNICTTVDRYISSLYDKGFLEKTVKTVEVNKGGYKDKKKRFTKKAHISSIKKDSFKTNFNFFFEYAKCKGCEFNEEEKNLLNELFNVRLAGSLAYSKNINLIDTVCYYLEKLRSIYIMQRYMNDSSKIISEYDKTRRYIKFDDQEYNIMEKMLHDNLFNLLIKKQNKLFYFSLPDYEYENY